MRDQPLRTFLMGLFVWTFVNLEQSLFGYAMPELIAEFRIDVRTVGISAGLLPLLPMLVGCWSMTKAGNG